MSIISRSPPSSTRPILERRQASSSRRHHCRRPDRSSRPNGCRSAFSLSRRRNTAIRSCFSSSRLIAKASSAAPSKARSQTTATRRRQGGQGEPARGLAHRRQRETLLRPAWRTHPGRFTDHDHFGEPARRPGCSSACPARAPVSRRNFPRPRRFRQRSKPQKRNSEHAPPEDKKRRELSNIRPDRMTRRVQIELTKNLTKSKN